MVDHYGSELPDEEPEGLTGGSPLQECIHVGNDCFSILQWCCCSKERSRFIEPCHECWQGERTDAPAKHLTRNNVKAHQEGILN